jgi:Flp pilus assembly secretin CpaC
MAALCARGRAKLSPLHCLSAVLVLIALAAPATAAPPPPAEPIVVVLDQARILQLPDRAATVVVGNPLIADLTIQPGGLAVITGKGYGATNFIIMDKAGAVLLEKIVEVQSPSDNIVVVYRGVTHQTYSCTPECSRRVTLGDTGADFFDNTVDKDYFSKTLEQTVTRNAQAAGAGALNAGH